MMMLSLADAIDALIEANAALRKRRALAKPERDLAAAMRTAFLAQERAFLSRLALLKPRFSPEGRAGIFASLSASPSRLREVAEPVPWGPLFDEAALATLQAFQVPLDEVTAQALQSGMLAGVADLGVKSSFDLKHPRAVDYLRQRGADSVLGINQTTRNHLRTILTQAAEEGWGYNRTAKEITARYAQFAGPPARRYLHVKTRAHAIAIFEVGSAYEEGNLLVAKDLQDAGLEMQHAWGTSQDSRVRPEHRANEAEGFIPLDQAFSSGHDRPPTDTGCRCYTKLRRKPTSEQ